MNDPATLEKSDGVVLSTPGEATRLSKPPVAPALVEYELIASVPEVGMITTEP